MFFEHIKIAANAARVYVEAYSQNPKDDSCDGVDCGLEC